MVFDIIFFPGDFGSDDMRLKVLMTLHPSCIFEGLKLQGL